MLKTTNRLILIYCILYIAACALQPLTAEASDRTGDNEILAIGTGVIKKNNLSQAKKDALAQAQMKGIEGYLFQRLGNDGMINNFHRLVNEIIPGAGEEIENFNILVETRIDNQYRILVRLRINEKVIDEKLRRAGLVIMKGPAVKILFLISEKNNKGTIYWWEDPEVQPAMSAMELALYNSFQERGFSPVNRRASIQAPEFSEDLLIPDLTDKAFLTWGKLFSADVVICGKTGIIGEEEEVFLTLKALDVNKGAMICQGMHIEAVQKDDKGNNRTTQAIGKLADALTARLTAAIIKEVGSDQDTIHILTVTLSGLKSHRQFTDFRSFLKKDVQGVKSVKQTRIRKDSISIEIEFQGDENKFMERVLKHENLPFLLDYSQTEEGTILLEVE